MPPEQDLVHVHPSPVYKVDGLQRAAVSSVFFIIIVIIIITGPIDFNVLRKIQ